MIDLYTWPTPNGRKISILLEELDVEYTAHRINIGEDEQKTPAFLEISPNNRIPAMTKSLHSRRIQIDRSRSAPLVAGLGGGPGIPCHADPERHQSGFRGLGQSRPDSRAGVQFGRAGGLAEFRCFGSCGVG